MSSLNLSEIKEWLDRFQSDFQSKMDSLPQDDTSLGPKYSLLCRRLAFTRRTIDIHKKLEGDLTNRFNHLRRNIQSILNASNGPGCPDSFPTDLRALLQELHKLNGMLSLKESAFSDAYPHHREATLNPTFHIEGDPFAEVYMDRDPCLDSCASADFLQLFEDLDLMGKYFIMCFSVFPANTFVDKRTLAYWCMGMGVLDPSESQVERVVDLILEDLVVKGFVEAEKKNFKFVGFKVCPLVRCFAVKVAERFGFYAFNNKGEPSSHGGEPRKVFLSRAGDTSSLDNLLNENDEPLQKVMCILNVNEPYPDINLLHFVKMKNLSALCLGRSSADQHIELQSLDFLEGLKVAKKMTILSLRGISQVFQLPDALCKHAHLRVLDLNSCHNLEELPEEIGLLENLTHLDISKCYLLDRMPKGLALLTELRVLKGFLVVEYKASCDFASLAGLKKLSKMSLYVHKIDFPNDHEQSVFKKFSLLRDFTIQWGGKAVPKTNREKVIIDGPGGRASSITLHFSRDIGSGDMAGDISPSRRNEGGQDMAAKVPTDAGGDMEVSNADHSKRHIKKVISRGKDVTRKLGLRSKVDKPSTDLEEVIMDGPGGSASSITPHSSREIGSGDKAGDISPSRRNEGGQDVAAKVPTDARGYIKRVISKIQIKKDSDDKVPALGAMLGAVEKLVLQCYPGEEMPTWLVPSHVPRLKQLHIKGGKLRRFGIAWGDGALQLEMLRLNYLEELEMDVEGLLTYFPMMNILAKAKCPKLFGFPANDRKIRLPPRGGP